MPVSDKEFSHLSFTVGTAAAAKPQSHDSVVTVPRLAWLCFCRCRLDLCRSLHLSRDLYRPPQATLRNTLLLCNTEDSGKEWHHLAPFLTCVCGLVLSSKHAFMSLDLWGSLACTVSVGVMDACDITTASLMAWLMCALLLVRIISPVCVNICECTDLCRGLFLFFVCVGADRLQSQRVPIVAIPFIMVSLLWLVLCQLVATVIGYSGKGQDPADGSIVSV